MSHSLPQDGAVALSLKYFQILEERLGIFWEASIPICLPDNVSPAAISGLAADLAALLKGPDAIRAVESTKRLGSDCVQTVGFGIAREFDQFVKLGFLYGDRVILWDVISSRLLAKASPNTTLIATVACDILRLKEAARRGALVILPHPTEWCSLASEIAEDMRSQGVRDIPSYSLSMVLAVQSEGLFLHPYTFVLDASDPKRNGVFSNSQLDLYSRENYIFQRALSELLSDNRFAFLQEVSASEFQHLTSGHIDLRRELRRIFNINAGLSEAQLKQELRQVQQDITNLIDKSNRDLLRYRGDCAEATGMVAASALTFFGPVAAWTLPAIGGLGTRLVSALRKLSNKPSPNVVVQAFYDLQQQAGREDASRAHATLAKIGFAPSQMAESSTGGVDYSSEAIKKFGGDTEGLHYFLLEQPFEVAQRIVAGFTARHLETIVNRRMFQEAYIVEYLGELWYIDQQAFWRHIAAMFTSKEGLLFGETFEHVEVMLSYPMPADVWQIMLSRLARVLETESFARVYEYETEILVAVVIAQTTGTMPDSDQRSSVLERWLKEVPAAICRRITELIVSPPHGYYRPHAVHPNPHIR